MYECETCHYKTKRKGTLQRHFLVHKLNSEVQMFACEKCDYKAKHDDKRVKVYIYNLNVCIGPNIREFNRIFDRKYRIVKYSWGGITYTPQY
ncbi:hypothetical protein NQ317_001934 [Molorchus minor]|uniref:C2H2-type domain-containing protein n=1 Tax=Molorchus minor TaxID=1323400 RepID=A0ABQ9JFH0_9CUCU|nr:hypothetical protein NQ317_001934 [Molorchus minor]